MDDEVLPRRIIPRTNNALISPPADIAVKHNQIPAAFSLDIPDPTLQSMILPLEIGQLLIETSVTLCDRLHLLREQPLQQTCPAVLVESGTKHPYP